MTVFISYSSYDSDTVDEICEVLDELDVEYFRYETGISWGDDIVGEVGENLRASVALVVVLSPASIKSQWVAYEIGIAVASNVRVLPYLTHPKLEVPDFIKRYAHIDSLGKVRTYFEEEWPIPTSEKTSHESDTLGDSVARQFQQAVELMPELLAEMKEDVSRDENKLVREFVPLTSRSHSFQDSKQRFMYYEEDHTDLKNKIDILKDSGLVEVSQYGDYQNVYRMTPEFIELLKAWIPENKTTSQERTILRHLAKFGDRGVEPTVFSDDIEIDIVTVRVVLDKMVQLGYVATTNTNPKHYYVTSPGFTYLAP